MPAPLKSKNIAIIGGGPAGLIAAERLSQAGAQVHVYERKPSVGRKFLMAGRGGLNLTHSEPREDFDARYGNAQNFMAPLLDNFSPEDLRQWCEALGQETFVGSSGRVFPKTLKASPLLRAWLARLEQNGVTFHLRHTWQGWNEQAALVFMDENGTPHSVTPDATLLALGGASWPGLGSDGAWVPLLSASGVTVSPLRPSNCGFNVAWSDYIADKFAGQPLKNIILHSGDKSAPGEMMITRGGIEGGAVYALSSFIRDDIERRGDTTITIDLHPHQTAKQLADKLSRPRGRQSFATFLKKALNLPPLHIALLHEADKDIGTRDAHAIAALIKSLPFSVNAPFPIDRAISSAGGIARNALDDNFMIKGIPGTFAAGEMLDWEAPTGGYLLQGCFATGHKAAQGMQAWLTR